MDSSRAPLPIPSRTTLTSEVSAIIRQEITNGRFQSGEQLTESQLAKQFNISRAPVREALRQLENERLVVHFPHRGYFVRTIDINEIEELFQLRAALEGLAVSLLIERKIDDAVRELEKIVAEMEHLAGSADHIAATELDTEFHEQICTLSENRRLLDVWSSLRAQIRIAVLASNSSFPLFQGFAAGHRAVLEAIKTRDPALAQAALKTHIENGLANLRTDMNNAEDEETQE